TPHRASVGVRGSGFGVLVLGFEVLVLGFEVLVLGFEVLVLGFEVLVLGFEVLVLGFWFWFCVLGGRTPKNPEPRTPNPRTQNPEPENPEPEPRTPDPQNPEPRTQNENAEPRTPNPEPRTPFEFSPRHHVTVARGTDPSHQRAGARMDHDPLHRTDALHVAQIELMPLCGEAVADRLRPHPWSQQLAQHIVRVVRVAEAVADDRRLLERLLHRHPELDDVQEELQLRLRLRVGARRAEHQVRVAVLERERRVDRLPDALARLQR